MEWIERLNEAMNYIEEHLTDEIDYEELAKTAGCSTYHFQRMFAYMANVSLSEYIRRRKISLAADETLEEYMIPSFTWAVFPGGGVCPQGIQELDRRIVTEWLPTSGYEYANGPDIELYISPDPQNAKFEVWIPVVKTVKN